MRCLQMRLFCMTFLKRKSLVMVSWSNVVDMQASSFNYNIKKPQNISGIPMKAHIVYKIYICGERTRSLRVLIRDNAAQHDYI